MRRFLTFDDVGLIPKFNKKILKSVFCYWCREQQNFYFKFINNVPTILEFVDELQKVY